MALGAGVFPLGMSLDHLTRHQSGFDGVRPGRLGQEERSEQGEGHDDVCDAHGIQRSVQVDADNVKDRTGRGPSAKLRTRLEPPWIRFSAGENRRFPA